MTTIGTPARTAGITLLLCGLALAAVSALEFAAGEGRGDGDNPAESLRYFEDFGDLYSYSGLALVVAGVLLVASTIGIYRVIGSTSIPFSTASVFALIAGGLLLAGGVLRMQAIGTVPHIANLDQSWGEAAYLAVQMAGTQGLISSGMIAVAAWLVALGIVFARRRMWLTVASTVFPATVLLILALDLALPWLDESNLDGLFVVYIASSIIGIPLCCLWFGVSLMVGLRPPRPASSTPRAQPSGSRPLDSAHHPNGWVARNSGDSEVGATNPESPVNLRSPRPR